MLAQELEPIEREILVKAAIMAPSMQDSQPWHFRFRQRTVEVHRNPDRELVVDDPDGRMTLISCGAAVFNIRVAAASLGRDTTVSVVPDPDPATLVAEVVVENAAADLEDPAALFPYLSRRRTNRQPVAEHALPDKVRQRLSHAATREGAVLEWVEDPARMRWLMALASGPELIRSGISRRADQTTAGTEVAGQSPAAPPQGLETPTHPPAPGQSPAAPPQAPETAAPSRPEIPAPRSEVTVQAPDPMGAAEPGDPHPTLAVLWTARDDRATWVTAGQALERVLLVASTYGLAASMINQPFEHTDMRWLVRERSTGWSEPQVVLRFGQGQEAPSTPRRPAAAFVLA